MTREEVDELVSSLAASYDPAHPPLPNTSHPLFALTGSEPTAPDVHKGNLVISNEATRELYQKERLQKIDLQFAVAGCFHQPLVASYDDALRWIRYRCPEKLSSGFHRWYHGERNRCIGELRKKLEAGELIGVAEDGHEILPAAWGFIEFETIPIVRLRWRDLRDLWPAAFLDNQFLKSAGAPRTGSTSQNNQRTPDTEVVIEPITRSKLKAIFIFLQRGDRPKGKYRKSFPTPMGSMSVMDEFAYRVQLEVLSDRRDRHNAEVAKRRAAKADRENVIKINGALPHEVVVTSKLQPQTREFETGFDAGRIRHLLLDLENNRHTWLAEGREIQRLLNSPGKPPPDIDNELCEASSSDIRHSCE
jgi:hypothetical protein